MSELLLRPHHALCIRFFEGKGYSEDFVAHMTATIERLRAEAPEVTLCGGCDMICAGCPENAGGVCAGDDKVRAIDERALSLMEMRVGDKLLWNDFSALAYDRIIRVGRLKEVCRDCRWLYICEKKA